MRSALAALLVLALLPSSAAFAGDGRTLWLKDLYRHDELRVRPFRRLGRPAPLAWARLTRFFRSRQGPRHTVHPRLLRVLAHVQDHFGGRRLELMSGYRIPADPQALGSYHEAGHAADLWIEGVENRALFDYCRELQAQGQRLGCGFYPRAGHHVHIDVRSRATIWVDLATYGEGADYVADPAAWLERHPRPRGKDGP